MKKKTRTSLCIANDRGACSAAFPLVSEISIDFFPLIVQQQIKDKQLDKSTFKRCSYCGTVWAYYFDNRYNIFQDYELGTRELGSEKMSWYIENLQ